MFEQQPSHSCDIRPSACFHDLSMVSGAGCFCTNVGQLDYEMNHQMIRMRGKIRAQNTNEMVEEFVDALEHLAISRANDGLSNTINSAGPSVAASPRISLREPCCNVKGGAKRIISCISYGMV